MELRETPDNALGTAAGRKPLRRDAEENRDRILVVAQQLFAARGLNVTLDDIAHEAGVGVGTVYRRFPKKDDLVEALFEQRVLEMIELAEQALTYDDAWEGFVFLLGGMLAMESSDQGLREVILGSEYLHARLIELKSQIGPLLETLILSAQEQGTLRGDVRSTDIPILTAMAGAAQDYCRSVSPQIWKRYAAILLDGLRASRSTTTEMPEAALDYDQLQSSMVAWKSRRSTSNDHSTSP